MDITIRRVMTAYGLEKRQALIDGKWYDLPEDNKKAMHVISNLRLMLRAPKMTEFLNSFV